ncbi:MAG: hypothetical protein M1320_01245 [Patescibacteria group bacterium]|nr:hypothetical protein [Patescibacteria group bacterium]
MKLKFKLNKYYLLTHALPLSDLPFPSWENLQNKLWEEFPKAYYLLTTHPEVAFMGDNPLEELDQTYRETKKMISKAFRSKEFKKLYKESEVYLDFIQKQWNKSGHKALYILQRLSGLPLPDKTITVFITHPKLYRGFALPAYNTIGLGYAEDYKNSSIINLCHEILHLTTKNTRVMHALIELLANNELRIQLNETGKYFIFQETDPTNNLSLYTYVNRMRKFEKKILPFWKAYLKNRDGRNLIDLEREITKRLKNANH